MIATDRNVAGDVIKRVREGIYVLFDVVCIHLIQNEYILFLPRLLKGILGTFWGLILGVLNWATPFNGACSLRIIESPDA
jgi:hypothetical protein